MVTYKIHLLRSGKTGSGGSHRRFAGQLDIPLSPEGFRDLARLRETMRYPLAEALFTSPLSRCIQTADILFPGLTPVKADGFADMRLGAFEGKNFDELKDSDAFQAWLGNSESNPPPNGETVSAFSGRVIRAAGAVFERIMRDGIRDAAIVTHGGVIMTLLASVGLPKLPIQKWAVDNGFGYTLLLTPQMWMRDRAVEVFQPIPDASGLDK